MEEFWVGIVGFEGQYEISNLRRIRSLPRKVRCRNNGLRLVSKKYLFTDHDTVQLGDGKHKGGIGKCVTNLMIKSFYSHLDPEEYEFRITVPRHMVTLDDIEVIYKEFGWPE